MILYQQILGYLKTTVLELFTTLWEHIIHI